MIAKLTLILISFVMLYSSLWADGQEKEITFPQALVLQKAMKTQGFYNGKIDGLIGPNSVKSILNTQNL